MARELCEPDGELAAEGDRYRRLGVRPARHHGRTMPVGLGRDLVPELSDESLDAIERAAHDERKAGVHDVLRRCSPVDVAPRLG